VSAAPINGTELFYVSVGEGLPCLVMHGGLGVDHSYLHPWLDPLGDMLHLIYYDHRRNGRSGRASKETMTHAQLAADADALRSHLGFARVAVMGHSYGGFIALEYALDDFIVYNYYGHKREHSAQIAVFRDRAV
jgi:proline iminopeptidase